MSLKTLKIPSSINAIGSNNLLFLIGGGAVAFAIYTFLTSRKGSPAPTAPAVVNKQSGRGPAGTDGYGGRYSYNPSAGKNYYPRVSSFMSRAYTTTTTTTDVTTLKNKVLQQIINGAESVTVVLNNLTTVKAEIETYTAQLQVVVDEQKAGRLSASQVASYLDEVVKKIAEKLQITLKQVQFPGPTGNPYEVPEYYNDYYKQYMEYMKQLMQRYYQYYQPSYQYYPGSMYNYYQPYQYQYPYPYYPTNQFGGQSSYGFQQGYNPYAYGSQMYGGQGTQGYGYGQSQYNFY